MTSKAIGRKHPIIKDIKLYKQGIKNNNKHILVSGISLHEKLLKTDMTIESLLVCESLIKSELDKKILEECIIRSKNHYTISEKIIDSFSEKNKTDSIISISSKNQNEIDYIASKLNRVVILDALEIPGNIGSIFRTSDGAGIDAVFIINEKAKVNQYKCIKASMGGMFSIPWYYFQNIHDCMNWLIQNNFNVLLADPYGNDTLTRVSELEKLALVVGNERYGLSNEWIADYRIALPMNGICDSLNVATAASILIYAI